MDYSKKSWRDQQEDAIVKDKTRKIVGMKAMCYLSLTVLSILTTCLLSLGYANAATFKPSDKSSDIEIKIESTRPRLTPGTGLGITAEVTNMSDSVIYLYEKQITMAPPPEVVGEVGPVSYYAYFPTETHSGEDDATYFDKTIGIPQGESYKVLWYTGVAKRYELFKYIYQVVVSELRYIFFTPGNYTFTVSAKYWIHPEKPLKSEKYHTKVESKTLDISSPQSVILFGAMLGGLISYILFPQARRRLVASETSKEAPSRSKKFVREGFGILGAVLLSAIVTILLARISETQFLIKVTVADLWGAIAIGFVANYAGAEVINKIIDRNLKKQTVQKKENENRSSS